MSSIVPRQTTGSSNRNDDQYAQLAGKYVHEKSPSYYLELLPNGNYVLFEDTQIIGTYEVNGSAITLFVARRPTSKAKIEDGSIIDEQGDRWIREKLPAVAAQPEKQSAEKQSAVSSETDLIQTLPTAESILVLEPEVLGGYLLESLATGNSQDLRLNNFISRIRAHYKHDEVDRALLEAWAWLVRDGLLVAATDDTYFISRRGQKIKGRQDLEAYRKSNILPKESLHPVIAERVWPIFIRGDYETAVFQAFKEVEVAVRAAGGFQGTDVGTDLIEKAFDCNSGPLADTTLSEAERQAVLALFAGAIALFQNASSHRHRTLDDANEAAEIISLASLLMRTIDRRTESTKAKKNPQRRW